MDARGAILVEGGRWLVFAPLSPVGIGLAFPPVRWPVPFTKDRGEGTLFVPAVRDFEAARSIVKSAP